MAVINPKILMDISKEREAQDEKWGVQNHTIERWSLILGEEYGEVCEAMLSHIFRKPEHGPHHRLQEIRDELIQNAAVAVVIVDYLDRTYPELFMEEEDADALANGDTVDGEINLIDRVF